MQIVIPFSIVAKVFVYKRESFKLVAGWFSNYEPPYCIFKLIKCFSIFLWTLGPKKSLDTSGGN